MRALLFDGQLRFREDMPEPVLPPGEALIRPTLVGICNTDLEITRGYMGFRGVLGHEFVGRVVACDDSRWLGVRVVGEINAACFQCPMCLRGVPSQCPNRTTLGIDRRDGAMAELFCLPTRCLVPVPDTLSDEEAVFAEPLAAAVQLIEQIHIRPTDQVALVGDGKLGLLCAQVLRLTGCDLTVIGRHPRRWDGLRAQGIRLLIDAQRHAEYPDQQATTELAPMSFDIVVDCTGNASGLAVARQLVRPRGRIILKSTFAGESGLSMSMVVVDEIQISGSRCGPFAPALRLLERRLVQVVPMIESRYSLADGLQAFDAAPGHLKIVLEV
jgi:alcohol dehydrogenase